MRELKKGDRVRVINLNGVWNKHLTIGMEGKVIDIDPIKVPNILVEFDNWIMGHTGYVHETTHTLLNRWWCSTEQIACLELDKSPKKRKPMKPGGRCEQLLNFLLEGRSITQGQAIILGFGTRLASTVHKLRERGHTIMTTDKKDAYGNPYAEYSLVSRRPSGARKAA